MSHTSRTTNTATPQPDDCPAMQAALRWLTQAGLRFTRPTRYQLKIGSLSFYPDKGTLYRDGDRQAFPDRGLLALQALLGNRQPRPAHRSDRTRPIQPGPSSQDDGGLGPYDIDLNNLLGE